MWKLVRNVVIGNRCVDAKGGTPSFLSEEGNLHIKCGLDLTLSFPIYVFHDFASTFSVGLQAFPLLGNSHLE